MFNFPITERPTDFKYNHNFIRTVTFQFDYSAINLTNELLEKLKQFLSKKYSNIQNTNQGRFQLGSGLEPKAFPISVIGLQCTTKDNALVLNTMNTQVSYIVQGTSYTNYESFKKEYQSELETILKILGITKLNRIAIRKVNVINFDLVEDKYTFADILGLLFNSKMVENMQVVPGSKYLTQGLNTMVFVNEANYWLNLNYGFVKDVNSAKKANGILDIDLINKNENPIDSIFNILEDINKEIFNIFSWSLQDSTRKQLNEN